MEIMSNNRISWREYALRIAYAGSLRSEDVFRQVGACALDFENRVLGVAYNGLAPGKIAPKEFWLNRDYRRPFMIHAETNLLSLFKRGDCKLIAVTCFPCSSCAKSIVAYGIKEVVFSEDYQTDNNASLEIFDFYKIKLTKLELSK